MCICKYVYRKRYINVACYQFRSMHIVLSGIAYCLNYQSFKYIGGIMVGYLEIICGVVALLLAFYYYSVSAFSFWKSRGVPGPKPAFFFGNTMEHMFARISLAQYLKKLYEEYKNEPMVGLYMRRSPVLVLKDPELIKDVLIKDFPIFSDRGLTVHERTEPLSLNLLNLEPERWRPLRSKLTPMFTSGKLKDMFGLILECAEHFEKYLDKLAARDEPADFREVTAKYTTDVIGSCAFGIEMSSMSDEDSEFRKVGREIFRPSLEGVIRLKMRLYASKLYDWLGYIAPDKRLAPFFTKLVTDTMRYRKEHDVYRPDFIHMLMQLKEHPEKVGNIKLTDSLITAQAFVFFAAGFETSSSAMSNTLYELALNQQVQDKLREEIRSNLAKHGGELKYEHVKDMEYLDKVFKETQRKYPVAGLIPRRSTAAYTFAGTKVSIPKGLKLWIPMYAIHRDPDIYPNPDVFNPENFNEDAIEARHPMTYLPFGDGPRNCIGARFAVYQTKVGLITILRNYKVITCEKTMIPYQFATNTFLLAPKGGIYLKLKKLNS
ncbi:probable cytochrome P450 6a20 isoform X1 [Frieseomelitta varia]|uniref:probable cytochrome P450 6a20 isoform X1 n=1 Tax=Frieseomelitta varia TaxID=561572 RepID=UPI001CB67C01|nr:probable cytochrome P450 6a20 isoform X1 [Frieseomelitta varia]